MSSYYTVLAPCVVGQLHYATVPVQPILVADDVAADLVASGVLTPYRPGDPEPVQGDTAGEVEPPARHPRRRRES